MAALKQTTYSNEFSSMKIILQILLKYVPLCLIDNMSALVYRMDWRLTGDKQLFDLKMGQLTDVTNIRQ